MSALLEVQARHLRVGDWLLGSRREVTRVAMRTDGRVNVRTLTSAGVTLDGVWNARTTMRIQRGAL